MSAPAPELSIVILSWNTRELLQRCLESLRQVRDTVRRELLVVDNASSDGSAEMVRERFPEARLLVNARNEGYARGNNIGIAAASGANVLLLNSDTEVRDGSLDKLVGFLRGHRAHGAVGAGLRNADGSVQPCCMRFPTLLVPLFFDMNLDKRWPFGSLAALEPTFALAKERCWRLIGLDPATYATHSLRRAKESMI